MVFFITFLRALAAIIITNAHYTGVYPTDLIANGGLLGDVIFFGVSGFCLCDVKMGFGKWYKRRVLRVYPAPIIITLIYWIIGWYSISASFSDIFAWFVYPTNYHFVASIVLLYIPFYFLMKNDWCAGHILQIMLCIGIIYLIFYIFMYDKTYYHIDNVREPMIRFLFFISMLVGAYFKKSYKKYIGKTKLSDWLILLSVFILYFASKMVFVKIQWLSAYQIINQLILVVLLYCVFRCISGIGNKLDNIPTRLKKIITYLSEITLEIYVVQYEIIPRLAKVSIFPVNWIIITVTILAFASILHLIVKQVNKLTNKLI